MPAPGPSASRLGSPQTCVSPGQEAAATAVREKLPDVHTGASLWSRSTQHPSPRRNECHRICTHPLAFWGASLNFPRPARGHIGEGGEAPSATSLGVLAAQGLRVCPEPPRGQPLSPGAVGPHPARPTPSLSPPGPWVRLPASRHSLCKEGATFKRRVKMPPPPLTTA